MGVRISPRRSGKALPLPLWEGVGGRGWSEAGTGQPLPPNSLPQGGEYSSSRPAYPDAYGGVGPGVSSIAMPRCQATPLRVCGQCGTPRSKKDSTQIQADARKTRGWVWVGTVLHGRHRTDRTRGAAPIVPPLSDPRVLRASACICVMPCSLRRAPHVAATGLGRRPRRKPAHPHAKPARLHAEGARHHVEGEGPKVSLDS
jgi:hypothetical protein